MRAFNENEFNYCPLTWMFNNRTLNNKINKLHERALRITYKDEKSKNKISPPIINEIFNLIYNLRTEKLREIQNVRTIRNRNNFFSGPRNMEKCSQRN